MSTFTYNPGKIRNYFGSTIEELRVKMTSLNEKAQQTTSERLSALQQTTAYHFPKAFAEESLKTGKEIAQSIIKAPLRIAKTAYDVPQQAYGFEPSEGYTLPGLGEVKGYGRQFLEETGDKANDWSDLGTISAGLKAVSEGIIDASFLGGILDKVIAKQALKMSKAAPASEAAQPLTRNIAQTREAIKSSLSGGEAMVGKGETGMTPSGEFLQYAKGRLDDVAQKLGMLNPKLEQLYRAQVKPDATSVESILKSVMEPATKILNYYERGGLTENLLSAITKNLPKAAQEYIREPKLGMSIRKEVPELDPAPLTRFLTKSKDYEPLDPKIFDDALKNIREGIKDGDWGEGEITKYKEMIQYLDEYRNINYLKDNQVDNLFEKTIKLAEKIYKEDDLFQRKDTKPAQEIFGAVLNKLYKAGSRQEKALAVDSFVNAVHQDFPASLLPRGFDISDPTHTGADVVGRILTQAAGGVFEKTGLFRNMQLLNRGKSIKDVSKEGFQGYPDLTTKFLEYAKGKTTLSRQEIMDFARRPELKKGEADLLLRKLEEFTKEKGTIQSAPFSITKIINIDDIIPTNKPNLRSQKVFGEIGVKGLQEPVLIDAQNKIVDGNNRWAYFKKQGVKEIEVVQQFDKLPAQEFADSIRRKEMGGLPVEAFGAVPLLMSQEE